MDYYNSVIEDTETIKGCFLLSSYHIKEDKWYDFLINKYQNDLYKMVKYLEDTKDKYRVSFNGIGFDFQVIEFILRSYEEWADLSGEYIAFKIWRESQEVIERSNYNIRQKYTEKDISFKMIDVPLILHWFNDNKFVSLKQAEFELRAETIENFDISHEKTDFTAEEVSNLVYYCHNDCKYTYEIFKIVLGDTEHPLYKGKNKLVDREIIQEEVGLPCLNWDDVKIGAEWNKKDYISMTGKDDKNLRPKEVNNFYGKKYKFFFPNTVKFQTKELQEFIRNIGETFIKRDVKGKKKQEFKYKFNKELTVTIRKGGAHSCENERYLKPSDSEIFIQNDIGSQYPNALRKYGIYPRHLGKEWNEMLVSKIERRLKYKQLYKDTKDPKYNSLQEMGKLSLNGGAYGRLNTKGDWQQDPCAMLKVTIGCQLEILMIVEALIVKGFRITSINTDGWDCIIPKVRLQEYLGVVKYYEELIGNKELGNVEFSTFEWMAQLSVSDYIAKKSGDIVNGEFKPHVSKEPNDHLKLKGDFSTEIELHRNSSFKIIALAYSAYFDRGIPVEDFINNHTDIFDFCARSNSGKTYVHYGFEGINSYKLPKLIRYYVSKEGNWIKKMVKENNDTGANDMSLRPKEHLKTVCNRLPKEDYKKHLDNVLRDWYIRDCKEKIYLIEHNGKAPHKTKAGVGQISLF